MAVCRCSWEGHPWPTEPGTRGGLGEIEPEAALTQSCVHARRTHTQPGAWPSPGPPAKGKGPRLTGSLLGSSAQRSRPGSRAHHRPGEVPPESARQLSRCPTHTALPSRNLGTPPHTPRTEATSDQAFSRCLSCPGGKIGELECDIQVLRRIVSMNSPEGAQEGSRVLSESSCGSPTSLQTSFSACDGLTHWASGQTSRLV